MSRRDGVFKRNGWWWIDYHDADGRRHREKAAPSYEVAKLVYRDKMNAIAKGEVLGVREEGMLLRDFAPKVWWPRVGPRLAPDWSARVRGILDGALLPRFGGVKLAALRKEAVEAWAAERLGDVGASTFNKELWVLKNLGKRAVEWGYLRANPAQGVKRAREPRGRVRYLEPDERERLLNGIDVMVTASDGRTWTVRQEPNARLRLYILAALHTGARRAELLRLMWGDVDMRQRTITFRNTKNGDSRTVPMTETLRSTLAELPRPLDPAAPVLPPLAPLVLTRSFARLVQRLGLKNLTFHDLRHDAASTLAMESVPLRTIAEILGHRDLRMTARYAHLSPQHLRDAMRALERRPVPAPTGTISAPAT
ncbi:MAG: tyrosine-type recombinase/integrase [Burkholderiales bacterium]